MKSIIVKMAPGITGILSNITGLCRSADDKLLPDGSGFSFHRWIDDEWAEYYLGTDDVVYESVVNEMIAQGLTITFPPPEMIPIVDEFGAQVFDGEGNPVMVEKEE